jgi:hypothetical protein
VFAAFLLVMAVGVACDSGSKPATPIPSPVPTVSNDRDGDGIPNDADACPDEKEDHRWSTEDDGCPDTIADLVGLAREDIDGFWQRTFEKHSLRYTGPHDFVGYDEPIRTACGRVEMENAFYCPVDHAIYYDITFFQGELERSGDFGPVFIVAHEWGHLVQALLGLLQDPERYTIDNELQADCFAGVYSADADSRDLLEAGDMDEAVLSLLRAGDPLDTPFFDEDAHGSPGERIDAFLRGTQQGLDSCLKPLRRSALR